MASIYMYVGISVTRGEGVAGHNVFDRAAFPKILSVLERWRFLSSKNALDELPVSPIKKVMGLLVLNPPPRIFWIITYISIY